MFGLQIYDCMYSMIKIFITTFIYKKQETEMEHIGL